MKRWLFIMLCISVVMLPACSDGIGGKGNYANKRPNDEISRAVIDGLNKEEVYYGGKETIDNDILSYDFLFYKERDGQLLELIEIINESMREMETDKKIMVSCRIRLHGGSSRVITLKNYSSEEDKKAEYTNLCSALIRGEYIMPNSIYNLPETYRNLPNIKFLTIYGDMADVTERDNIDWNEYFPELESLEIISKEESY